MSSENEKKIYVPKKFLETSWGTFFEDLSISLVDLETMPADEEQLQITQANLPENFSLENAHVKNIFKTYFSSIQNFDLINCFNKKNKDVFKIKINNYLNLGSVVDLIVIEACKNKYSFSEIRSFVNSFLKNEKMGPVEITFADTEAGFAIQFSMSSKNFEFDSEWQLVPNFVEISEYKQTEKIIISTVWFAEEFKDFNFSFWRKQPASVVVSTPVEVKVDPEAAAKMAQMEQQMLRMKELMIKMKDQLKAQQAAAPVEVATTPMSDSELQAQVTFLETENLKLQAEKKQVSVRLQLANRKLEIMDKNLDDMDNKLESRANPELENELEALKKQNKELEEKLNSKPAATGMDPQKELEFLKLTEIKALYENKMKEQVAEIKKLEARVKVLTTQIESLVKKLTTAPAAGGASPAAAITPGKTNDNHAKQLEHASNRVAEVTREFNDKKKEVIQVKQENAKLNSQIYELLKKIQYYEKKAG